MTTNRPDWDIAILDGQPEVVLNRAMIRELARTSPLGEQEALRRLRQAIPEVDWDAENLPQQPKTGREPEGGAPE